MPAFNVVRFRVKPGSEQQSSTRIARCAPDSKGFSEET